MKLAKLSNVFAFLILLASFATSLTQLSADEANSVIGVGGYDLVSYQTSDKPIQGNENYTVQHDGVHYLFASKENADTFSNNKEKYLPAYGGFCAFGAAHGKKFDGDPTVWEVVDGRLYLNLNKSIQKRWTKDIPGFITKADKQWTKIKDVPAADL